MSRDDHARAGVGNECQGRQRIGAFSLHLVHRSAPERLSRQSAGGITSMLARSLLTSSSSPTQNLKPRRPARLLQTHRRIPGHFRNLCRLAQHHIPHPLEQVIDRLIAAPQ